MKTLTIKLSAPLQSYGDDASFARRTTSLYPSKSAVVGLLAAALGYQRDDDEHIQQLNQLAFAARIDQPGRVLTDYQTVEWKKDTRKVTYRDYLQDAVFVVAIGGDDVSFVDQIKTALRHPHFQLFLGRRSNVPAGVLKINEFRDQTPVEVLQTVDWAAAEWYQKRHHKQEKFQAKIVADANLLPDKRARFARDNVESFDQRNRRFSFRSVAETSADLTNPKYVAAQRNTDHDIMEWL